MTDMLTIGLTGRSGAGKGEVAAILRGMGVPVLDTDLVYRNLTSGRSPCLDELEQAFGPDIVSSNGGLDRAALRTIVFGDRAKLELLNRIAHSHILTQSRGWLGEQAELGHPMAVLDAPQLYESGFDTECDAVIAVVAPDQLCVERIMRRDGISREQAELRLNNQRGSDFFRRTADYVIDNDGDIEHLRAQVKGVYEKLINQT